MSTIAACATCAARQPTRPHDARSDLGNLLHRRPDLADFPSVGAARLAAVVEES